MTTADAIREDRADSADEVRRIPPDEANRGRRRWGCAIVIVALLATPILLIVGLYVGLVWSSRTQTARALAELRAAGDPSTVEEMHAYYSTSPEIEQATAHWLAAIAIVNDRTFVADGAALPYVGDPGYDVDKVDPPEETLREADAFLAKYRAAIEEAHAARRSGGVARFPVAFEKGVMLTLENTQEMRTVARLLQLDFEARLAEGDVDGAVEDVLSLVAASEGLKNEPILVSQLVRVSVLISATKACERMLERADLSDEQLARLQTAFARQDFQDGMKRAARGEQWFLVHTMTGDVSTGDPNFDRMRMLPFQGADLSKSIDLWRGVIDASDEGWLETIEASEKMMDEFEAIEGSKLGRFQYPMTLLLMSSVDTAAFALLRGEASARLAEAAIACERYRLAHGEWPKKLDDLVPEFLPSSPIDPLDGRPLRYVIDESGALLYSVGDNRTDDGGVDDPLNGDLIFRLHDRAPVDSEAKP